MKETPILFSAPMVRAILDQRKSQTRRVIKPQPLNVIWHKGQWIQAECEACQMDKPLACPYGGPGDRLWVRETWAPCHCDETECTTSEGCTKHKPVCYVATHNGPDPLRWRPSIHMPRWASRITLEVTGVRVERVQEISEEDARAEGVDWCSPQFTDERPDEDPRQVGYSRAGGSFARDNYRRLWDKINLHRGYAWCNNPWCWVITFTRSKT